jgi:hypothetical protein
MSNRTKTKSVWKNRSSGKRSSQSHGDGSRLIPVWSRFEFRPSHWADLPFWLSLHDLTRRARGLRMTHNLELISDLVTFEICSIQELLWQMRTVWTRCFLFRRNQKVLSNLCSCRLPLQYLVTVRKSLSNSFCAESREIDCRSLIERMSIIGIWLLYP